MPNNKTVVSQEQIAHQYEYMQFIARMNEDKAQVRGQRPKAFTQTFRMPAERGRYPADRRHAG